MNIPCPERIDCPGSDWPITNYSAEDEEVAGTFTSIEFPNKWFKLGCLSWCMSEISQEDADQCALAQESQCEDGDIDIFCNEQQVCDCVDVNGSTFTFVVPAGTFCSETLVAANALAYAYACSKACGGNIDTDTRTVHLGALARCCCYGVALIRQIPYSGATPVVWAIVTGSLPTGLHLNPATGIIYGTPTATGSYTFTVAAYLSTGSYALRTYVLTAIGIANISLGTFTVDEVYSLQLTASGGSGHYTFAVTNGAFPAGITMTSAGLISGTPTTETTGTVQITVTDTELGC